jgi:hypothetical protein
VRRQRVCCSCDGTVITATGHRDRLQRFAVWDADLSAGGRTYSWRGSVGGVVNDRPVRTIANRNGLGSGISPGRHTEGWRGGCRQGGG